MVNKDLGMVTAYAYAVSKGYTGTEEEFAALMADYAAVGQRAEAAATAAAASATAASGSASDSAASATAAEGFAGNASTSAGNASQAAQNASQSATAASGSATSAAQSATQAAGSATTASTKATEAAQSATAAAGSATTAGASATAAQAAQTAAEAAQTAAETAQGAAEDAAASVEASAAQIAQNTADISLVKSHLEDVDATLITEEASGTIASFTDGADGYPMRSVEVTLEPIQDLHGQANPYPAGGSVNQFNPDTILQGTYNSTTNVWSANNPNIGKAFAYTFTENTQYTFSGKAKQSVSGKNLRLQIVYTDESLENLWASNDTAEVTFSITSASGKSIDMIRWNFGTSNGAVDVTNFQVELGTTASTYHPYSNICPISGRQSVTVTRSGVNVWDEEWEVGIINADGAPGSSVVNAIRSKNFCSLVGGETYYATCGKTDGGSQNVYYIGAYFYDADKTFIGRLWVNNQTFTAPDNARYFKLSTNSSTVVYGNTYNHDITVNYPSTDHDYHPGTVASVEVQLGQTVYGGTVDVVSGEMVVDRAYYKVTESTELATDSAYTDFTRINFIVDGVRLFGKPNGAIISNIFKPGTLVVNGVFMHGTTGTINITPEISVGTTQAQILAWLVANNAEICYELAQPITITLTPEQLTTVLGTNNVWSDADSVSVDYVADTKLYIEQLTEPDADMIADANITSGSYFMVGNQLFLATANIANGAAVIEGTNCTRTNLAAALNAINA